MHHYCNIQIFCIMYLGIIYFAYAVSEWWTFLNITILFLTSTSLAASAASVGPPVTVIVPFTSIYV